MRSQTATVVLPPPEFPSRGTPREQLRYLLRYAILAPSTHNTQPWRFRVDDDRVRVYADPSRALSVIDRSQRQLVMSVGAAIYNLRIAMQRHGMAVRVDELPGDEPDLIARVTIGGSHEPTPRDRALFDAIPRRHTNRQPFAALPVAQALIDDLAELAAAEGATLVRLHPSAKAPLAEVISQGDRAQFRDPAYRKELARWLVPSGSRRRDGIPFVKKEYGSSLPLGPLMVRSFDIGDRVAASEAELATSSAALVVLATTGDRRDDWLATGQALEAVLLGATAAGLAASFLNQPLEVEALRPRVAALTGGAGHPQLVLRMGYGPAQAPTPRRPLADVIDDGDAADLGDDGDD